MHRHTAPCTDARAQPQKLQVNGKHSLIRVHVHRRQAVVPCAICLCSSAYRVEKNETAGSEPVPVQSVNHLSERPFYCRAEASAARRDGTGSQTHSVQDEHRYLGHSSMSILYTVIKRLFLHGTRQYSQIPRRLCGASAPSICLFSFLARRSEARASGRVAPQIAGTSWNSQRDLKRVKITAEEATEASLSKAVLSGGPGVKGGREGASQRHDIHFITLKPTVGSTRSPGFPMASQRME